TQCARRQEPAEAAERADLQLQQQREEGDLQRRRDTYAVLNSATRAYRTAGYDLTAATRHRVAPGLNLRTHEGTCGTRILPPGSPHTEGHFPSVGVVVVLEVLQVQLPSSARRRWRRA
ncbi:hypothetical protein VR46_38130, partial [Streptomyces sp. NRRL S-444]